ncbi:hypothetical protein J3E68DRAFT_429396 [Trichoderma sp. SZMC 28012]
MVVAVDDSLNDQVVGFALWDVYGQSQPEKATNQPLYDPQHLFESAVTLSSILHSCYSDHTKHGGLISREPVRSFHTQQPFHPRSPASNASPESPTPNQLRQ